MGSRSRSGGKGTKRQAPKWARILDYCFGGLGYVFGGIILVLFVAIFAWMLAYYFVPVVGELPTTPIPQAPAVPAEQGSVMNIFATTFGMIIAFAIIVVTPVVFGWAVWWFTKAYSRVVHTATRRVFGGVYSVRHVQWVKVILFAFSTCAVYAVNLIRPATIFFTIFLGAVLLLAGALLSMLLQTLVAVVVRRNAQEVF